MANGDIYKLNVGEGEFDIHLPDLKSLDNLVSVVGNLANEGEINLLDKPVITIRPTKYENSNLTCAYHVHFSDANTEQPQEVSLRIAVSYRALVVDTETPDFSQFVTKQETLEQLCKVEQCTWAKDIVSQIESNARAIGAIETGTIRSGTIATQEWVKENYNGTQSDSPQITQEQFINGVRDVVKKKGCFGYLATNNPDNPQVWKTTYGFDGITYKDNELNNQNATTIKYKFNPEKVSLGIGNGYIDEPTIASQEWVIPKLNAINILYNFDGQITKISEDFAPYKYLVWNIKISGFVDFVMKHWPQQELNNIKNWGRVTTFLPPKLFDIDWVRNTDGGTNYIDEAQTELIAASYDINGNLILTIRVNGVADGSQYDDMINHLVLITLKYGQPLLVTNDPTIDNEIDKRPITPWKPRSSVEKPKSIRLIR